MGEKGVGATDFTCMLTFRSRAHACELEEMYESHHDHI